MKRISSKYLFLHKQVFPVCWLVFLVFISVSAIRNTPGKAPELLLGSIAISAIAWFMTRQLVGDLVDEVYDCGDKLLVRNAGKEDVVPLSNVMNISSTPLMNPPRITLRLVAPGKFGNEIAFWPETGIRLNPFAKLAIAEDLIERAYRARVVARG